MESKLNRIAAFIDSLPMESKLGEIQSTMIYTRLDLIGGVQINSKECSNSFTNCGSCYNATAAECGGATNGGTCRNGTGLCVGAINDGICTSVPIVVDPIIPSNPSNCKC